MTAAETAAVLRLRVQPRASRPGIGGWRADGALAVRVASAPVDGAANAAVAAVVAGALGVRPAAVTIVRGQRTRDKIVRVEGLTLAEAHGRLAAEMGGTR
jgi:uncharacterized protein (TIGR00251 family)